MGRADENLRIGAPALGPLDQFLANVPFSSDVDLMITHAHARKEVFGVLAIGAVANRINVDISHDRSQFLAKSYMDVRAGSATLANTSTSTLAAPARNRARAQPSTVAPDVSTSSIRTSRRPVTAALPSSGTRKAPWTFAARSVRDRPTCCAVGLTRLSAPAAIGTPVWRDTVAASTAD